MPVSTKLGFSTTRGAGGGGLAQAESAHSASISKLRRKATLHPSRSPCQRIRRISVPRLNRALKSAPRARVAPPPASPYPPAPDRSQGRSTMLRNLAIVLVLAACLCVIPPAIGWFESGEWAYAGFSIGGLLDSVSLSDKLGPLQPFIDP